MANDLNTLADQLLDNADPKLRRDAAKQMGALRDANAIAYLVQAYTSDPDKSVRKAAEEALRIYRQMEQGSAPAPSGGDIVLPAGLTEDKLLQLRKYLIVGLVVTVVLNVGLLLVRSIRQLSANQPLPEPVQDFPTPRDDLVARFQVRLSDMDSGGKALRVLLTTLKSQVSANFSPGCQPPPDTVVAVIPLARVDINTYPDLGRTHEQINIAAEKYVRVRNEYLALCENKDLKRVQDRLAQSGGADALIQQLDEALNKDLNAARALLDRAIKFPEPTVALTATPTEPPTLTPLPTVTPLPPVTPGGPSTGGTPGATTEPGGPPPTVPGLQSAGLSGLQKFRYSVTYTYTGMLNNQEINGTLRGTITYQGEPLIAQYEINITEQLPNRNVPSVLQALNVVPATMFAAGNSTYTVANAALYTTGSAVPRGARCTAFRLTQNLQTAVNAVAFVPVFTLTQEQAAGLKAEGEVDGLQQYSMPLAPQTANNVTTSGKRVLYYSPTQKSITRAVDQLEATVKIGTVDVKVQVIGDYRLLETGERVVLNPNTIIPIDCRNLRPR